MSSHFHYENWLEQIQQPEINLQWMYYNPKSQMSAVMGALSLAWTYWNKSLEVGAFRLDPLDSGIFIKHISDVS